MSYLLSGDCHIPYYVLRMELVDEMGISPSRNVIRVTAWNELRERDMDFSNFNNRIYGVEIGHKCGELGLEYW